MVGAGETVGVGTVVATFQSAPRPPGASMLVGPGGEAVGSVSGGCVEGAVYELAQSVVEAGPPVLERYGVSDDDAFAVGLTCGGILDVYVEKVSRETFPELGEIAADIGSGRPVALATVVEHPDPAVARPPPDPAPRRDSPDDGSPTRRRRPPESGTIPTLGSARMDDAVRDDALGLLAAGHSATLTYGPDGERRGEGMKVFVWAFAPKPRMLVFGAIDFAAAVARVGAFLGYHVTVCDARPVFATATRFPEADEVVVDWPHRYLQQAGRRGRRRRSAPWSPCSPTTRSSTYRCSRWRCGCPRWRTSARWAAGVPTTTGSTACAEAGLTDDELSRLSSPIGLDLGARTPEETAVSIAAEIIAARWGGSGRRLAATADASTTSPTDNRLNTPGESLYSRALTQHRALWCGRWSSPFLANTQGAH